MPLSTFPPIDGNKLLVSPAQESSNDGCVAHEARARLDDEIAVLTFKLCTLRSRRNTLSPVSRLPTEILASIFIHYCARTYPQPQRLEFDVPAWVAVSYVCRHWRDVALNTPVLWSFLFVSSQEWTDELLVRSKTAPLKVCVDADYPGQTNELYLLKKVAPLANRIQDLTLYLTRREAERILSLFSSPAPLLQCLRVSVEKTNHLGDPALKLTGPLFDSHTPSLRDLELTNYIFPLKSLPLDGLTSLRLRDLGTSFQPTLAELGVILRRMPGLEHLHLENALPGARIEDGQSLSSPGELSFPRLSRFSLVAPFSTVVLLLSLFHLPIKTQVRLRCCYEPDTEDYTPIYSLLAKRFIVSEDEEFTLAPVIHTCFVEAASAMVGFIFSSAERDSGRHAFSLSTTEYNLGQLHEDWDCNIPLKADIVLQTSLPRDREEFIGNVCRRMPLTNLGSAHFSFDVETILSSNFWWETFGYLEGLRCIKLSEVNLGGFVRVIESDSHPYSKDNKRVFAPILEELELYSASFPKEARRRAESVRSWGVVMAHLYDALAGRQAAGRGFKRLIFADRMYVDNHTEGLKEVITSYPNIQKDEGGSCRQKRISISASA